MARKNLEQFDTVDLRHLVIGNDCIVRCRLELVEGIPSGQCGTDLELGVPFEEQFEGIQEYGFVINIEYFDHGSQLTRVLSAVNRFGINLINLLVVSKASIWVFA